MSLPPFVTYPARQLQEGLLPEEWEACLDSWIFLTQAHLLLPQISFSSILNKDSSLTDFLLSYLRQNTIAIASPGNASSKSKLLKSNVFLLVHRALSEGEPTPLPLLDVSFFEDLSIVYGQGASLRELLVKSWTLKGPESVSPSFRKRKISLTSLLEGGMKSDLSGDLENVLQRTASLLRILCNYGQYLMVGSDFLDSLATCYEHKAPNLQKKLVVIAYLCLSSLMDPESPRISNLVDHLYTLKDASGHGNLLKAICSSTPFLRKLRTTLSGPEAARAKDLLQQLSAYEATASGKPKRLIKRRVDKGKSRATAEYGHGAFSNIHVHKMSLVTQIQDLFPDLGSAFIIKMLDEYSDDVELVTSHLLEDSLPAYLKQADRTEDLSVNPIFEMKPMLKFLIDPTLPTGKPLSSCQNLLLVQPHPSLLNPTTLAGDLGVQSSTTMLSPNLPYPRPSLAAAKLPIEPKQPTVSSPLPLPHPTKPQSFPPSLTSTPMTTNATIPTTSKTSAVPLTLLSLVPATMSWTLKA